MGVGVGLVIGNCLPWVGDDVGDRGGSGGGCWGFGGGDDGAGIEQVDKIGGLVKGILESGDVGDELGEGLESEGLRGESGGEGEHIVDELDLVGEIAAGYFGIGIDWCGHGVIPFVWIVWIVWIIGVCEGLGLGLGLGFLIF